MKFKIFLTTGVVTVEAENWGDAVEKAGAASNLTNGIVTAILRVDPDGVPFKPAPTMKGWDTER